MIRRLQWVVVAVIAAFIALYAGDCAVFQMRGAPLSRVTVNRFVTIPLKGGKKEFDYVGTADAPCSQSLFPQAGQTPCWQLRRNPNQGASM